MLLAMLLVSPFCIEEKCEAQKEHIETVANGLRTILVFLKHS